MQTHLVLTVIGPDRPGLVSVLSDTIAAGGGNWLDSRMASLAGQFAGILLVDVASDRADDLRAALQQLDGMGLRLVVAQGPAETPAARDGRVLKLDLLGQDRPGIVRDISRVLAEHQVSIGEFHTERASGSFSGEAMFKATALLTLPAGLDEGALQQALESLANELMVDLDLGD
ncbi:MAG: glycine cleavage system protein R [Ideonella sp.]|nr:glycine cleavage system protein R [Ideonella sp.]